MTSPTAPDGAGRRGRAVAGVVAGLVLAALLLRLLPGIVDPLLSGLGGAVGEAAFTLLVYGPLLALALFGGALTGVRAAALGERAGASFGRGAGLGLTGFLIAVVLAGIAGTLTRAPGGAGPSPLILAGLVIVVVQVASEEVFFRGWLQPLLARVAGERVAVPVVAVAFAALHLIAGGAGPSALVNMLLGGLLFGVLAARGGGVAGAVGAHYAWNAAEQLLFGLDPNPGVGGFGALFDLDLVGAARWGGSSEGLNASWAMTVALLAVLLPVAARWWGLGGKSLEADTKGGTVALG